MKPTWVTVNGLAPAAVKSASYSEFPSLIKQFVSRVFFYLITENVVSGLTSSLSLRYSTAAKPGRVTNLFRPISRRLRSKSCHIAKKQRKTGVKTPIKFKPLK